MLQSISVQVSIWSQLRPTEVKPPWILPPILLWQYVVCSTFLKWVWETWSSSVPARGMSCKMMVDLLVCVLTAFIYCVYCVCEIGGCVWFFTALPGLVIARCILNVPAVHNLWCTLERESRFSKLCPVLVSRAPGRMSSLKWFPAANKKAWPFLLVYLTLNILFHVNLRIFISPLVIKVNLLNLTRLLCQIPDTCVYSVHTEGVIWGLARSLY